MEFAVGDKIIHPKFGAGQIVGETHRELVEGFESYYVIEVIRTGATAYVPMAKMTELGVRKVMSRSKFAQVLAILRDVPSTLSSDYKKRQAGVQEKLRTCRPGNVAEAVRDLAWHGKRKRLTQKDEDLFNQGRDLLASEMALAADTQLPDAQETIDTMLQVAFAKGHGESETDPEDIAAAMATSEPLTKKILERVGRSRGEAVNA